MPKKKQSKTVEQVAKTLPQQGKKGDIFSDILGSYTGMGADGEVPEQDADDL